MSRPRPADTPAAARFFLALADPTRLELLTRLREGGRTVGELVAGVGCPQPKVSRHLKVLKEARLVRDVREGRNVRYELTTRASWPPEAREWMDRLDSGLLSGDAAAPPAPPPGRPSPVPPSPKPAVTPSPGADLEDYLL